MTPPVTHVVTATPVATATVSSAFPISSVLSKSAQIQSTKQLLVSALRSSIKLAVSTVLIRSQKFQTSQHFTRSQSQTESIELDHSTNFDGTLGITKSQLPQSFAFQFSHILDLTSLLSDSSIVLRSEKFTISSQPNISPLFESKSIDETGFYESDGLIASATRIATQILTVSFVQDLTHHLTLTISLDDSVGFLSAAFSTSHAFIESLGSFLSVSFDVSSVTLSILYGISSANRASAPRAESSGFGRTIKIAGSVGLDVSDSFESRLLILSGVKERSMFLSDSSIFEMSTTFPDRTSAQNHGSPDEQTSGLNLGMVGIVGSILVILFLSLIIWFFVKRRRQKEDSLHDEAETIETTMTFDDETQDEPEYENPISDENGRGSESQSFDLDADENFSML
jgi:hypothetical protein